MAQGLNSDSELTVTKIIIFQGDCSIHGSERSLLFNEWAAVSKWIK